MTSATDIGRSQFVRLVLGLILAQMVATGVWVLNWRGEVKDLFTFYSAGSLGNAGRNPYDMAAMKAETVKNHAVTGRTGDTDYLVAFNPPEALIIFAPLAKLPWTYACLLWLSFQTLMALGLAYLSRTFGGDGEPRWLGLALVSVVLLNPLTYRLLANGQCTMIVAASIALGQWAFESKRPVLGTLLWSLSGIKPHMAIPFLVVAFVMGGWRRFAGIVVAIGVLNVVGCLITTGTPRTLIDYVRFVTENHLIGFNTVNQDQVSSWNRVVFVLGGPAWNLTASSMLGGYAAWMIMVWLRHGRPSLSSWVPSYLLAAAAVSSVFFAISHGYDFVMLVLMAPLIFERFKLGQRWEAASLVGLIALTTIPRAVFVKANAILALSPSLSSLTLSYRALILAILAVYLLVRGQSGLRTRHNPQSDQIG